jgi:serine/threonine-protein kinase
LQAKIADGGMAAVFVARRLEGPMAGELVAIKMIRDQYASNRDFVTMFTDEAKILAQLRHPNIVRHYDFGTEAGHVFLSMELLQGQSLWTIWEACRARGQRLPFDVVAWVGARVAEGLHYAHELVDERGSALDIVHRDVNATNIFITYAGDVKIIDFGLAKAANRASKTAAGVIKGKAAYMSPEQAVGAPVDCRTDIFALGTTLWELSCDRRLFKRTDEVETLRRVHAAEVPDPTELVQNFPPKLWEVLRRALARERDARYATAEEFARDLDRCVAELAAERVGSRSADSSTIAAIVRELFRESSNDSRVWRVESNTLQSNALPIPGDRPGPASLLLPPKPDPVSVAPKRAASSGRRALAFALLIFTVALGVVATVILR